MDKYILIIGILIIWIIGYMAPPFLMLSHNGGLGHSIYNSYIWACHQMPQRSYCVFNDSHIGDCITSTNGFHIVEKYTGPRPREVINSKTNVVGYEFGVCARCFWFYISFVFGILGYIYVYGKDSKENPNILLLIVAIIPLAIDGVGQLFGLWASTNVIRMITGTLSGGFGGYFAMPLINRLFSHDGFKDKKSKKSKKKI